MAPRYALQESSDEEAGDEMSNIHSDERLAKGLRDTVARVYESGNLQELTVKRVRLATETALGLEEGFFKGHEQWKAKSETIIKEEAAAQDIAQESNVVPKPKPTDTRNKNTVKKTPKQDPEDLQSARKRRKITKTVETDDELSTHEDNRPDVADAFKPSKPISAETVDETSVSDSSEEHEVHPAPSRGAIVDQEGSESEMSVVLDEPAPEPKKRREKSTDSAPKKGKAKAAAKPSTELDPDTAEIKRLQGWLIKCGIRKIWSRELAAYDTPKAKIKHLKSMLENAGMKGRYSLEKARQIREGRELLADLEAVKEGAMMWGTGNKKDDDEEKPRRRLMKGRQSLAFLSDDGEETD
ncbi:putative transcriptional regulator [Talaromyces proteolyticus]|uniref:Transcriptional regulator n=1 Tax=Talaromyces proteolyticus TaxID=1131652 RepID=A0AAD4KQP0_9EURO|nr:putative transcriptional regulator [Talaromyces proteolyticus]KAH8693959.1 putative transcriptional regulator [Talaromyces proteolyticus]